MRAFWIAVAVAAALSALLPGGLAAQESQERVHFPAGASSASVSGAVKGYAGVDYLLGAAAGQTMHVTLKTTNSSLYFNVLPPGSDAAIFIGSTSGNEWTGTLPTTGDYTVRVYLMRNAARRKEAAKYTITFAIGGAPAAKAPAGEAPAGDAKVAGTPFHATGTVPCSTGADRKPAGECPFGVVRGAPGNAQVHLTSPAGGERVLDFAGGTVTSADAAGLTVVRHGDAWSIGIGDEHYTIPDAAVVGG